MNPSMSSQADSPVRTSATPDSVPVSQENEADCGGSSIASSKRSRQATSSSKTSPPFALADWIKYSGASLRSGMMRNGIVFPLKPLALLTVGTGCGSLPTPCASEHKFRLNGTSQQSKCLEARARRGELPMQAIGPLNPLTVEWLMAFPAGWTA